MPSLLNEGFFRILDDTMQLNSHAIVRISDKKNLSNKPSKEKAGHNCLKQQLTNGLIKNQSYIVLEAKLLDCFGPDNVTHLIKLCNPWKRLNQMAFGSKCPSKEEASSRKEIAVWNDGKWSGSWSEHSPEWINLPDDVKAQLELDNDSHFWIPIESFVETFTDVDICHISRQQAAQSDLGQCKLWHSTFFHGRWITGISAGGCYNEETFHQNPAYLVPIYSDATGSKQTSETPTENYTVMIGLMQKYRSSKRTSGMHDLKIGFHLFRLEKSDLKHIQEVIYDDDLELTVQCDKSNFEKAKVRIKMSPEFFHTKKGEHAIKFFTNVREVTARYQVAEGSYLVIPSTYGKF